MRNFTIHVGLSLSNRINDKQVQMLVPVFDQLINYKVTMVWHVERNRVGIGFLIQTISVLNKLAKKKGMVVHNVIQGQCISMTALCRRLARILRFEVGTGCDNSESYAQMKTGNQPSGCHYSSCLGRTIYIAEGGDLGICPYVENSISLIPLSNGESIEHMFSTEEFRQLLIHSIEHRKSCSEVCELFGLCKGGCPLMITNNLPGTCSIEANVNSTILTKDQKYEQSLLHISNLYKM